MLNESICICICLWEMYSLVIGKLASSPWRVWEMLQMAFKVEYLALENPSTN